MENKLVVTSGKREGGSKIIGSRVRQPQWHRSVAKRSYPMSNVRGGGREELLHIQGKEQQLCFAGAAVKRYHRFKVRKTHVRW